jgi:tetratricopeptide (TPR) repeat protein
MIVNLTFDKMKKRVFSRLVFFFLLFALATLYQPAEANAQKKSEIKQAQKIAAEADQILQRKDYKTAVERYSAAIALVPSLAQAHYGKGTAHAALGEYAEAAKEMDAALAGGYKPLDIYRARWRFYFELKNFAAALADARKAAQLDPKDATFLRASGEIQLAANSFQEALNDFQKYVQTNPNDADVYYFIAAAYKGLNNAEKQIEAAEEAVRRNTKFTGEAYFLIAEAMRANKNQSGAVEFYRKAIAFKPTIARTAYQYVADNFRRRNLFKDAVDTIKNGLQNFPDDARLYVDLGRFLNLAERNAEAITAAERAAKLEPENAAAHAGLCRIYYETKQYKEAQQACERALKINPEDGASNVYSGFVNLSLGRDEIAKDFFRKAVAQMNEYTRANPQYFDGFYLLGNSLYYAEQPQKAVEAYLKTLELNPNYTRARFNLGLAYFVAGNLPAAREQYGALLKTNKDLADKLKAVIDKK